MTVMYTPLGSPSPYAMPNNLGVSKDAYSVEKQVNDMLTTLFQTQTVGSIYHKVIRAFHESIEKCPSPNWDGYDAKPTDILSWQKAVAFSRLLPSGTPQPDIYSDPDGEATFEWCIDRRHLFSVTVTGNGELIYAGLFENGNVHGTAYLNDELPEIIQENIIKIIPAVV